MFYYQFFSKNIEQFSLYRLELVRRPTYTTRYRTARSRYPDGGSPQRRTAVIRRIPETIISEGILY